jgi:hypothetical protein
MLYLNRYGNNALFKQQYHSVIVQRVQSVRVNSAFERRHLLWNKNSRSFVNTGCGVLRLFSTSIWHAVAWEG